jgi:hypothetical protein
LEPLPADWLAVVDELVSVGVRRPEKCCHGARANGCLASEVRRVIEFWLENKPAWNEGTLYFRILGLRPDENHTRRWPAKSPESQQQDAVNAANKKVAKNRTERARAIAQRELEIQARAKRDERFGGELDAMKKPQLREFVSRVCPALVEMVPKRGPTTGLLRDALLLELERSRSDPTLLSEVQG